MIRGFLRFADAASMAGAVLGAVCLALICVLLFAEVAVRSLFGDTLGDSWEFAAYLMSLTFMLGAAHTLRTGSHVRVNVLQSHDSRRNAVTEVLASSLGLAITAYIAFALTDLAWQSYIRGVSSATSARVPLAFPRAGLALGAWLLVVQLAARIAAVLSGEDIERPASEPEPEPELLPAPGDER
jgi:TRAP-type C4-dicarboxylate transport system permease small subunit